MLHVVFWASPVLNPSQAAVLTMAAISTAMQFALSGPFDASPGSGALLAAVALVYFFDVVPVHPHAIVPGIALSEKTIPYALLLQIATASRGSVLAGLCGLVREIFACSFRTHAWRSSLVLSIRYFSDGWPSPWRLQNK